MLARRSVRLIQQRIQVAWFSAESVVVDESSNKKLTAGDVWDEIRQKPTVTRGHLDRLLLHVQSADEIDTVKDAFRLFEKKIVDPSERTLEKFADACVRIGCADDAVEHLKTMSLENYRAAMYYDAACVNKVMAHYIETEQYQKAIDTFEAHGDLNIQPTQRSFTTLVEAYLAVGNMEKVCEIIQNDLKNANKKARSFVIRRVLKAGQLDQAMEAFQQAGWEELVSRINN